MPGREPGQPAMRMAEGAEERPGTSGMDKMNEIDKVQYQAAAPHAQNSIDPDQQKLAFEKMDDVSKGGYTRPQMDRSTAYARLKATGKYSDDQINAKLMDSSVCRSGNGRHSSDELSKQMDADLFGEYEEVFPRSQALRADG